jgi:hypothetical protein
VRSVENVRGPTCPVCLTVEPVRVLANVRKQLILDISVELNARRRSKNCLYGSTVAREVRTTAYGLDRANQMVWVRGQFDHWTFGRDIGPRRLKPLRTRPPGLYRQFPIALLPPLPHTRLDGYRRLRSFCLANCIFILRTPPPP